jgi:hypothetical protein
MHNHTPDTCTHTLMHARTCPSLTQRPTCTRARVCVRVRTPTSPAGQHIVAPDAVDPPDPPPPGPLVRGTAGRFVVLIRVGCADHLRQQRRCRRESRPGVPGPAGHPTAQAVLRSCARSAPPADGQTDGQNRRPHRGVGPEEQCVGFNLSCVPAACSAHKTGWKSTSTVGRCEADSPPAARRRHHATPRAAPPRTETPEPEQQEAASGRVCRGPGACKSKGRLHPFRCGRRLPELACRPTVRRRGAQGPSIRSVALITLTCSLAMKARTASGLKGTWQGQAAGMEPGDAVWVIWVARLLAPQLRFAACQKQRQT